MGKAKYRVVAALAAAAACCLGAGVMAVSADAGDVVAGADRRVLRNEF